MENTTSTRVPLNEARHHTDLRGSAFHPFRSPLASMILAGIQYTGSKSTRPGYPKRDRPIDEPHSTTLIPGQVWFDLTYLRLQSGYERRLPCLPADQRYRPSLDPEQRE
jgi:hypothetical protein